MALNLTIGYAFVNFENVANLFEANFTAPADAELATVTFAKGHAVVFGIHNPGEQASEPDGHAFDPEYFHPFAFLTQVWYPGSQTLMLTEPISFTF